MDELIHCPFCGGIEIGVDSNKSMMKYYNDPAITVTYWIVCRACFSSGSPQGSKKAAIAAWNKRAKEGEE